MKFRTFPRLLPLVSFCGSLILCWLPGNAVLAGSGHSHDADGGHSHAHAPISSEEAASRASKVLKQLADTGKIDSTWSGLKAASMNQKLFSKGPEWVITFKNDTVADATKQTLYLFFTLDGHYIAANYTGN